MTRFFFVLLGFAAIILAPPALAQEDEPFVPGFIVTLQGDTLHGEVADLVDQRATRTARFRDASGSETMYQPGGIRGWGIVGGRSFVSIRLRPTPGVSDRQVFALPVVEGDAMRLYSFEATEPYAYDPAQRVEIGHPLRYAVGLPSGEIVPLFYVRRRDLERDEPLDDRQYRRALLRLTHDCPTAARRIRQAHYSRRDISAVVSAYNTCQGSATEVQQANLGRRTDIPVSVIVRAYGGPRTVSNDEGRWLPMVVQDHWAGTVWTVEAGVEPRLLLIDSGIHLPFTAYVRMQTPQEGWIAEPNYREWYTTDDFNRLSVGLSLAAGYRFSLGAVSPHVRIGAFGHHLFGERSRAYHTAEVFIFPASESGYFAELGGEVAITRGAPLVSFGIRYEKTGIGHIMPPAAIRNSWWTTTSMQGVIGFRF
ncbi:hypothetical protein BH23BAC4_BH23BAC4_09640 [soil metagenome]